MLSIEERKNLASRDNTWWSYCFIPGGEGEGITTGYRKADFSEAPPAKAHIRKGSSPAGALLRSG